MVNEGKIGIENIEDSLEWSTIQRGWKDYKILIQERKKGLYADYRPYFGACLA